MGEFHCELTALRAPKVLPWFARQAGLDDEVALRLWQRAVGESVADGKSNASACATVLGRFLELLDSAAASRSV